MTDELREALEAELTAVMCHKSGGYDPLSPADIAAHLAPILERAAESVADFAFVAGRSPRPWSTIQPEVSRRLSAALREEG